MEHLSRRRIPQRIGALLLLAGTWSAPLCAQLPPCDTLDMVGFTYQPILGTSYGLYASVVTGTSPFAGEPQWDIIVQGYHQYLSGSQLDYTFPVPDQYLVCVEAPLINDQQVTCLATHCEVLDVQPHYPDCHDSLVADFTIEPPQGNTVTFIDQSFASTPIGTYSWTFGDDGSNVTGSLPQVTHTFPGPGPYGVLLIIHADSCWSYVTKWVYMGPADVPCDVLLYPDVRHAEVDLTTALYDASITSGLNTTTRWDLGDGTSAEGRSAFHTYAEGGEYTVTATTSVWGPLASDTCSHTSVMSVIVPPGPMLGVEEHAGDRPLLAHPLPFTDAVTISDGPRGAGAGWEVLDPAGRLLLHGVPPTSGPFVIDGATLRAGLYILRMRSGDRVVSTRLVKQ